MSRHPAFFEMLISIMGVPVLPNGRVMICQKHLGPVQLPVLLRFARKPQENLLRHLLSFGKENSVPTVQPRIL
jgi:hypothetical protein